VTSAQTWDVSYGTGTRAPGGTAPECSAPPGLGAACPASLRQVFLAIGPESAKAARDFTKAILREWGLDGLAQEAALIASELVTNAIRHGACCAREDWAGEDWAGEDWADEDWAVGDWAPPDWAGAEQARVELSWQRQAGRVICMVTDQSPRLPVLGSADEDAESGRGLQVVAALSAAWGWMMLGARSKAVWAALAILPHG
jgi:hypothetical protein